MTDALVAEDLQVWKEMSGDAKRFVLLACGFNLGDMGVGSEFDRLFKRFPQLGGIGEPLLRTAVTYVTRGCARRYTTPHAST